MEAAKEVSKPAPPRYPASDTFELNLGNFIGAFSWLDQDYGSFIDATKHKDWEKASTYSIVSMLHGLTDSLIELRKDIKKHGIK